MTSAYASPFTHTLSRVRGKILSRTGKGVPDVDVAFRFAAKLTLLGATNGITQIKIETEVFCARLKTKFSERNF